jgi:radical SAM protein with 4Fe4S-binding SPASM domain
MKTTPYLTIIVFVKDNARALAETVGNIRRNLGRFGRPYEIFVIDDSSTADAENIGRNLAARSRYIKYLQWGEDAGDRVAFKTGINVSDGTWVLFATADGRKDFKGIKDLLKYTSDYDLISGYEPVLIKTGYDRFLRWLRRVLFNWRFGYVPQSGQLGLRLIKRDILQEIPLQSDGRAVDYELVYRSIRSGFRFIEVPVPGRKMQQVEGVPTLFGIFRALNRAFPRIRKIRNARRKHRGRVRTYIRRQWCMLSDRPIEASLDISGRCDLQCVSCDIWSEPLHSEKDTVFWVGTIDDLYRLGVRQVLLIGGEPLMRDDIGRIIRAISIRGMTSTIFTNGFRLLQRASELVESGLNRLVLSIDGPEPAVHDGLRGASGVFNLAMEGIEKIREEANIHGRPTPEMVFHTTASVANAHAIPEMFDFARRREIALTLQAICQVPKPVVENTKYHGKKIASRQYMIGDFDLLFSKDIASRVRQEVRHKFSIRSNLSTKVFLSLSEEHLVTGTFPVIPCGHVHHTVCVNPQGAMYPCGMMADYHYASLTEATTWESWNGQRRKDFIENLKREPFRICKYCCHYLNNLTPGQAVRVMIGLPLK